MILALVIFAVTYLLMLALPKERPWVALCSAAVLCNIHIDKNGTRLYNSIAEHMGRFYGYIRIIRQGKNQ